LSAAVPEAAAPDEAPIALAGEARDVALAEAQHLLAHVQDERRRERIAELIADVDEGAVSGDSAQSLEELLELGLVSGRIRAVYGPEGEQAALKTFRKLPLGKELSDGAKEISGALQSLVGRELEKLSVTSVGPGGYVVTIGADGLELSVRFDRQGARLHTVSL
jgi:hypothetical protein